jgi:hypothetical protein
MANTLNTFAFAVEKHRRLDAVLFLRRQAEAAKNPTLRRAAERAERNALAHLSRLFAGGVPEALAAVKAALAA